jgi:polyphosphate glucokinase
VKILVIDIGGTHVKLLATGYRRPRRFDSGPKLRPAEMVAGVQQATKDWEYEVISMGYPGPTAANHPAVEPLHLGPGWVDFDFVSALGHPVRMLNDAAMQALGGYSGGRMLFLGLGTGLGSALIVEGHLQPLELAHLQYRKGKTFEDFVGESGRKRLGNARWRRRVIDVVERLKAAMQAESVLLGGGNARRMAECLRRLPSGTRLGGNADAFRGGFRMWDAPEVIAQQAHRGPQPRK